MRIRSLAILSIIAAFILSACSVNVKKNSDGSTDDKNVDIKTPFTDIHVQKDAAPQDAGLSVYPGARLKPKKGNDDSTANVNLSAFGFGLRVVVLKYESDDQPAKIQKYYQDELRKYGSVLECHTSHRGDYNANVNHDSSAKLKVPFVVIRRRSSVALRSCTRWSQRMNTRRPKLSTSGVKTPLGVWFN